MLNQAAFIGQRLLGAVSGFGRFTRFSGTTAAWLLMGERAFGRWRLLVPQLYEIGTKSIPVVMIVGGFMGMVLGIEVYEQFEAISQESRLGGVIGISVVKQIGPVLAAAMVAGRVGGMISAELGTMRVTEQIDALRVMGTDPVAYLVVPRVVACVIMMPILTVFSDLVGIAGGYMVCVYGYGVNAVEYNSFAARLISNYDVITGLAKSMMFGLFIGMISCYKGFYCDSGAAGVGRAATDSFVTSFIAIIASNFFLASFLKNLYFLIFGYGGPTAFSG